MQLICVAGAAGSGKDTICKMLTTRHLVEIDGREVDIRPIVAKNEMYGDVARGVQLALADPLKAIVMKLYDFSYGQCWGPSEYRNAPDLRYRRKDGSYLTPRDALQKIGTEGARAAYDDTWIELALRRVDLFKDDETVIAFSDVRFFNEIKAFKHAGAKIWRVLRDGAGLAGENAAHKSEQEQQSPEFLRYVDVTIDNNGTIFDLREKVRELIRA